MLRAEDRGASAKASVLSATCSFRAGCGAREAAGRVDAGRHHAGLHRARQRRQHRAARAAAARIPRRPISAPSSAPSGIEIWTDVPGMFSANPRATPTARLLRALHYDEAQEIASSGAKVLHPRCLLPARQYQIPLYVLRHADAGSRRHADHGRVGTAAAQVKAVCNRKGITLISLDSPGMWHQVGFLADAFAVFKEHGMSVDLVSTSETNVTVSLDPAGQHARRRAARQAAGATCRKLCGVQVIGPCASRVARGPQHPRHPAQARRCVRAVRGAEGLPGEPGRERSQLHVRGGREPGRPARRAAARAADPSGARRPRAGSDVGAAVRASPTPWPRAPQPWWAQKRDGLARRARRSATAPTSTISRRSTRPRKSLARHQVRIGAHCSRSRRIRIRTSCARLAAAGLGFDCVSRARNRTRAEVVPGISTASASCSRRTSRRARNTSGRSSRACTSRSTTCSCCSTGSMPSRARACSCASIPASAAAITIT